MTEATQFASNTADMEKLFPKLIETQEHNIEIFNSANEIIGRTAKAIGESQTEFVQQEVEQAAKAFKPIKFDAPAGVTISAITEQWHENSLKLVTHMRAINDLAFDCGWQLVKLCAESFRQSPKQ